MPKQTTLFDYNFQKSIKQQLNVNKKDIKQQLKKGNKEKKKIENNTTLTQLLCDKFSFMLI